MRIRGSEIRKIIREELKRTLLKEGKEYSDDDGFKYEIRFINNNYLIYVVRTPQGPVSPAYQVPYELHPDVISKLQPQDETVKKAKEQWDPDVPFLERIKKLSDHAVYAILRTQFLPDWIKSNITDATGIALEGCDD